MLWAGSLRIFRHSRMEVQFASIIEHPLNFCQFFNFSWFFLRLLRLFSCRDQFDNFWIMAIWFIYSGVWYLSVFQHLFKIVLIFKRINFQCFSVVGTILVMSNRCCASLWVGSLSRLEYGRMATSLINFWNIFHSFLILFLI